MTTFRKIRLISDLNNPDVNSISRHQTPVNVSRLNDLDKEIESILSQDIDQHLKLKLYSQALKRFLTFQKLKQQEEIAEQNRNFENIKEVLTKLNEQPKKTPLKKRKKAPKKII